MNEGRKRTGGRVVLVDCNQAFAEIGDDGEAGGSQNRASSPLRGDGQTPRPMGARAPGISGVAPVEAKGEGGCLRFWALFGNAGLVGRGTTPMPWAVWVPLGRGPK